MQMTRRPISCMIETALRHTYQLGSAPAVSAMRQSRDVQVAALHAVMAGRTLGRNCFENCNGRLKEDSCLERRELPTAK